MQCDAFADGSFYLLVMCAVILLATGLLLGCLIELKQALLSRRWVPRDARVVSIEIDFDLDEENGDSFRPSIEYSYQMNGRTYRSTRFSYQPLWTKDYGEAARQISGLVVDSELRVYVNPERPAQAVVCRGANFKNYGQIVLVGLFLGLALYSAFVRLCG